MGAVILTITVDGSTGGDCAAADPVRIAATQAKATVTFKRLVTVWNLAFFGYAQTCARYCIDADGDGQRRE
jgi:hypothetical protein